MKSHSFTSPDFELYADCSAVASWLNHHPDTPEEYEPETNQPTAIELRTSTLHLEHIDEILNSTTIPTQRKQRPPLGAASHSKMNKQPLRQSPRKRGTNNTNTEGQAKQADTAGTTGQETDHNTVANQDNDIQAGGGALPVAGTSTLPLRSPGPSTPPLQQEPAVLHDLDATPIAPTQLRYTQRPYLPPPQHHPQDDSPTRSHSPRKTRSSSSRSTTSTSTSTTSNRSRSAHQISDLHLTTSHVKLAALTPTTILHLPLPTQRLIHDLKTIKSERGIIPRSLAPSIMPYIPDLRSDSDREFADMPELGGRITHAHVLSYVLDITESAAQCMASQVSEAAWNNEVHSRILWAAIRPLQSSQAATPSSPSLDSQQHQHQHQHLPRQSRQVSYENTTTARISDPSLLPRSLTSRLVSTGGAGMVDFAIVVEPDRDLKRRIVEKIVSCDADAASGGGGGGAAGHRGDGDVVEVGAVGNAVGYGLSINPSEATYLRTRPAVVGIETKRDGGGGGAGAGAGGGGDVQLAVWAGALFAWLERLSSASRREGEEEGRELGERGGRSQREVGLEVALALAGHPERDPEGDPEGERDAQHGDGDGDGGAFELPVLPVIKVVGHDWTLMLAQKRADELILWSRVTLGSTEDVLETWKVVCAVRRIAEWVDDVYRPWFERWCL